MSEFKSVSLDRLFASLVDANPTIESLQAELTALRAENEALTKLKNIYHVAMQESEAELSALRNQAGEPVAWRYEECSYTGKGLGTYLLSPTLLGKNASLLINPTPLYLAAPVVEEEFVTVTVETTEAK